MKRGGGRAGAGADGPSRSTTRRAIAGAGSMKCHRPGRQAVQPVQQQRVMGAGQHDRVGAGAVPLDEAGCDLGRDVGIGQRLAVQLGLGKFGEPRRADQM